MLVWACVYHIVCRSRVSQFVQGWWLYKVFMMSGETCIFHLCISYLCARQAWWGMARTCVLHWGIKITTVFAAREGGLEFHLELIISMVTLLFFGVVHTWAGLLFHVGFDKFSTRRHRNFQMIKKACWTASLHWLCCKYVKSVLLGHLPLSSFQNLLPAPPLSN